MSALSTARRNVREHFVELLPRRCAIVKVGCWFTQLKWSSNPEIQDNLKTRASFLPNTKCDAFVLYKWQRGNWIVKVAQTANKTNAIGVQSAIIFVTDVFVLKGLKLWAHRASQWPPSSPTSRAEIPIKCLSLSNKLEVAAMAAFTR